MGTTTYAELAILARSTAPHSREIPRRELDGREPNGRRHVDARPAPRRHGTRAAVIAAARREG